MRLTLHHLFLTVLILGVFLVENILPQNSNDKKFSDLSFEIALTKNEFLPLEPIPITLMLANRADAAVLGYKEIPFGIGTVRAIVSRDGKQTEFGQIVGVPGGGRGVVGTLQPNEVIQQKEVLEFQVGRMFPEPGVYELTLTLRDEEGKNPITSNPVSIEIKEPQGLDAKALKFIRRTHKPNPMALFYDLKTMDLDE